MEEQLVSLEVAKLAKEKGFNYKNKMKKFTLTTLMILIIAFISMCTYLMIMDIYFMHIKLLYKVDNLKELSIKNKIIHFTGATVLLTLIYHYINNNVNKPLFKFFEKLFKL